jgi:hypothetical protein
MKWPCSVCSVVFCCVCVCGVCVCVWCVCVCVVLCGVCCVALCCVVLCCVCVVCVCVCVCVRQSPYQLADLSEIWHERHATKGLYNCILVLPTVTIKQHSGYTNLSN